MSFAKFTAHDCTLFGRDPEALVNWTNSLVINIPYCAKEYSGFHVGDDYDAIINFIGAGDPAQIMKLGSAIFDITYEYDMMILNYLKSHKFCKYLFLSSGAIYGGEFVAPASLETKAMLPINNLGEMNWYAISKIYAEARHRALSELDIVDIRVFNYFSHTQNMNARFLMTDITRAIRYQSVMQTSSDYIVRDFLHPSDFYKLIDVLLETKSINIAVDCYSKSPVDKPTLLSAMKDEFGLLYKVSESFSCVNATGTKPYYYSVNSSAADFGYKPSMTSLEGAMLEVGLALELIPVSQ